MAAALVLTGPAVTGLLFGEVTSLPWGVTFPNGSPAWSYQLATGETGLLGFTGAVHPVHPTQIYEIIAAAVFGALAVWSTTAGAARARGAGRSPGRGRGR